MLSHKLSLCKFNKIEIILRIFSEHNTMILEINYKKKKLQKTQTHEGKWHTAKQQMGHWGHQIRN